MYIKRNKEPYNINGLDFEVSYYYYPQEDSVLNYGDGTGNPGSPASIEIYNVFFNGADIRDVALVYSDLYDDLEDEILAYELGE